MRKSWVKIAYVQLAFLKSFQSLLFHLYILNSILAAKKQDPDTDTSALEREIDELVYKLYGLTEEEIQIIENKK